MDEDETQSNENPSPSPYSYGDTKTDSGEPAKDETPASPEQLEPGVKTGGLVYTELEDGYRRYPEQKPVETEDDPTPQPEVDVEGQ